MTQLINNVDEAGEMSKDFTEVTIIALRRTKSCKMQQSSHSQPYRTYIKDTIKGTQILQLGYFGQRLRIVCWLHRLAAGIRPCKLD
jgi:hypothetical protein